jgi:hypothetical protein
VNDTTNVKGLSQLNEFLQTLPVKMEKNVLRGSLRAGMKEAILPEAKAQLATNRSVKTGVLQAGLKVGTTSKGGRVTAYVRAAGKHGFVARWLEYGVAAHKIVAKAKGGWLVFAGIFARSVDHPGFQPKPFLRPALDARATAAVVASAEYMKQRLATKNGLDTSDINIEAET